MPINYLNYPPDWSDRIRPDALKRAGYRCQECGAPNRSSIIRSANGDWIAVDDFLNGIPIAERGKSTRIILTVAHLNHLTWDNRPENLKVLCQLHHLRHDAPHKARMRQVCCNYNMPDFIAELLSPAGRHLTPVALARLRALTSVYLHLASILERSPVASSSSPSTDAWLAAFKLAKQNALKLGEAIAQVLSREFAIQNPQEYIHGYLSVIMINLGHSAPV